MDKRINIVITLIGVLAVILLIAGCGDGREDAENKVLTPFVTAPKGAVTNELNTQTAAPAFEGATHLLVGTLTVSNEQEFRIIAPANYTTRTPQLPQIVLTLTVDMQTKIVSRGNIKIIAADTLGPFKYEANCTGASCGNLDRLRLTDTGGFIDLISSGNNMETGIVKIDDTGSKPNLGSFSLTVQTLTK